MHPRDLPVLFAPDSSVLTVRLRLGVRKQARRAAGEPLTLDLTLTPSSYSPTRWTSSCWLPRTGARRRDRGSAPTSSQCYAQ